MDQQTIILIAIVVVALLAVVVFLYILNSGRSRSAMNLGYSSMSTDVADARASMENDESGQAYENVKKQAQKAREAKLKADGDEDRFFRAGLFTAEEKADYKRMQVMAPLIAGIGGFILMLLQDFSFLSLVILVLAVLVGMRYPSMALDSRIKKRDDDIMFFLPLVIEQVAIGVSSSLDVGPCLQQVVGMADERDNHNPVTELMSYVLDMMRTGLSLEEALTEVAIKSGHAEIKHTFTALAQVAKHGGEISKQLHELANAVSGKREAEIEAKIKKLELKATGPVALVLVAFIIILLGCIAIQIKNGMSKAG